MLPFRRVRFTLSIWLTGMSACLAQTPPSDHPAWSTLFDGAQILWGGILIAAILTAALLAQLIFTLMESRVNPPALTEALARAIQSGNYQEAWETCNRWRQTTLARILQPALERIGQGREPVEARLAEETRRELRHVSVLSWGMLGGAVVAAALCGFSMTAEMRGVALAAMSPDAPRALAFAMGDIAVLAAVAVAVILPATAAWFWLRARAGRLLQAASEQSVQLVAPLPYEEIVGVRIGRDFHAGTILGDDSAPHSGRLQVSKELTTLCPSCNGPINSSRNSCPHCGQLLAWS